ncbi:TPA: glycosyltransferase family 4 protein [Enterococcus faecium]|uniref:glycosyltransferase family 4 protein n=1 Tax=Enterococcus TaxID=1350 RepID=UPI000DEB9E47|nr:glycosyltransferase family 4 protein [Enterococcus faecium]MBD9749147.1 glycosyltransferase family 4 protein [Enterococcus faecium]MCH3236882.1 glycosyltransferase family 4 protein [Enterococcus faecium]MCZ1310306.1 glycosyltransferase family 4 protein [Enterococcus faecium]MCZ1359057.1 glycosyltransferase family 4 protein [Enterococcus faecium]NMO48165.1 glycosyltransferase family 4 protein [Enterococcus faecium]
MEKILLISNDVLHYRQKIYNYFYDKFQEKGCDFQVLSNRFQNVNYNLNFTHYEIGFSIRQYIKKIKEIKPQYVILFLHLKNKVMFPIIMYCKSHNIPVIYWNHGINIKTPNAKGKNAIFHCIHNLCDSLVTYTPEMRKYFSEKNQKKLFIAYNTLNFSDIDKDTVPAKDITRKKYGITEKKVILYISRIMPYKRVNLLMDAFADLEDIAVVIVGPGFSDEQRKTVDVHKNLYYLGEKYGEEVNEIYKMGDVFSTPGHIGLAMNEALFWGLPVVLLEATHAPEIYYMKNGVTGYLAKDEEEFKKYMIDLLHNDSRLKAMSDACNEVYNAEVSIDRMFKGFEDAIDYCKKG